MIHECNFCHFCRLQVQKWHLWAIFFCKIYFFLIKIFWKKKKKNWNNDIRKKQNSNNQADFKTEQKSK